MGREVATADHRRAKRNAPTALRSRRKGPMSSPYSIARTHLEDAFEAAAAEGVEADRLCKAFVSETLGRWLAMRAADDVRSEVEYELEHMSGDVDIPFMRP
jgi:hypothetical protein